jgi:hypothetical protein
MKKINKLDMVDISFLHCPTCRAEELNETEKCLVCDSCGAKYKKESDKLFFTDSYFDVDNWESKSTEFDLLKRGTSSYRRIDKIGGPRIRDLNSI